MLCNRMSNKNDGPHARASTTALSEDHMNNPNVEGNPLQHDIDALVEFVHRGCAPMLDLNEVLRVISSFLEPNSSMNYEYRFAGAVSAT